MVRILPNVDQIARPMEALIFSYRTRPLVGAVEIALSALRERFGVAFD
jgi:hypothetical protein